MKAAILSEKLAEGDLLPSVRGLAKDLNVSVITTRKAYEGLEAESFPINMVGKGSFVAPKNMALLRETPLMEIEKATLTGFIGPNGAGKTTTIKSILNMAKPDEGKITVLSMDSVADDLEIKAGHHFR